jgi:predicted nucleic acid-binding protein
MAQRPIRPLYSRGSAFGVLPHSLQDPLRYRRRGGTRRGVLPDFFVGAHVAVLDVPLLTRDTHRYRAYFPTLRLVTPTP